MFNTSPFPHNPFRHLPLPTPFSYTNYLVSQSRLSSPPSSSHRRTYHRHRTYRPSSLFADADMHASDQDDPLDDPYYMDTHSDSAFPAERPVHRHRRPQWLRNDTSTTNSLDDITSEFRPVPVRLARETAEKLDRDTVLILPPMLTRLRVHIRYSYGGGGGATDPLHVAVAGDMRFRDVIRQLVGGRMQGQGEVRVFVRMRGTWVEPGAVRVSEVVEQGRWVVDERGEVEVKIEVGGGGGGGVEKEGRGKRGVKAWEREMGRAWEVRG